MPKLSKAKVVIGIGHVVESDRLDSLANVYSLGLSVGGVELYTLYPHPPITINTKDNICPFMFVSGGMLYWLDLEWCDIGNRFPIRQYNMLLVPVPVFASSMRTMYNVLFRPHHNVMLCQLLFVKSRNYTTLAE